MQIISLGENLQLPSRVAQLGTGLADVKVKNLHSGFVSKMPSPLKIVSGV